MTKLVAPLGSYSASGKLANVLTYSSRASGNQVRFQRVPKDKLTPARIRARYAYKTAVQGWNSLSPSEQSAFNIQARPKNLTGFNLYISQFLGGKYFDSDLYTYLLRGIELGGADPTFQRKKILNDFILALKSNGFWTKLDVLYLFASHDPVFALVNLVNPTSFVATAVNNPTFISNRGFTGNGVDAYINTGFNPFVASGNYSLNDACRFLYLRIAGMDALDGLPNSNANRLLRSNSDNHRINQGTASYDPAFSMNSTGFKYIGRASSSEIFLANSSNTGTRTVSSSSVANAPQVVLRSQNNYGTGSISVYGMGANFNASYASLRSVVESYLSAVGVI